jgi:lipopolysaccharide biosynthesis glycosyltransferase
LDVYALNPSAGRWLLGLDRILAARSFEEVLYVDNDTYFLDDIERLFAGCLLGDIFAREEPLNRESHLGHDPRYIDELAVRDLVRSEEINPVIPFNMGVVLMKREVAT